MVTSSDAWTLKLGDFDFSPNARTDVDVCVVVFRRGKPEVVTKIVASGIDDGSIEQVVRHDNRDQVIVVGFKGPDPQVLAQVEEDLVLECAKARNALSWTPPNDFGATSVYDVTLADPEFLDADGWDLDELRGYRQWQITFRSLSFARAETLTTIAALTSGVTPSTSVIADGTSATNWTGTSTVTASGGTLRQTVTTVAEFSIAGKGTSYVGDSDFIYTPGSPITAFATRNYLYADVTPPTGGISAGSDVTAFADGVALDRIAVVALTGGVTRWWFSCADASVAVLKFHVTSTNDYLPGAGSMPTALHQIDNVTATNQAPSTGTSPGREALRTIAVPGSARTPASLAIQHETLGLGAVLIHSGPALAVGGYSPDLRRLKVSGSSDSTDTANITGKFSVLGDVTPEVFRIPTASLPRGGFLLLARPYLTSVLTDVQVTYSTRLSSGALIGTQVTRNRNVRTTSGFAVIADLTLPIADVPSSSDATVELSVLTMSGAVPSYDEMFLCALDDDSALTLVDCGAGTTATLGTANNRLWVESASLDRPAPSIWLGSAVGQADAYHAGGAAGSWMPHRFPAGLVTLFVANSGGANPAISATLYERAHTNMVKRSA